MAAPPCRGFHADLFSPLEFFFMFSLSHTLPSPGPVCRPCPSSPLPPSLPPSSCGIQPAPLQHLLSLLSALYLELGATGMAGMWGQGKEDLLALAAPIRQVGRMWGRGKGAGRAGQVGGADVLGTCISPTTLPSIIHHRAHLLPLTSVAPRSSSPFSPPPYTTPPTIIHHRAHLLPLTSVAPRSSSPSSPPPYTTRS